MGKATYWVVRKNMTQPLKGLRLSGQHCRISASGRILLRGDFHDFDKFSDTIDIDTLIHEGMHVGFPVGPSALALFQHLAPGVIRLNRFTSVLFKCLGVYQQGVSLVSP